MSVGQVRMNAGLPLRVKTKGVYTTKGWWKSNLIDGARVLPMYDDNHKFEYWQIAQKHLDDVIQALLRKCDTVNLWSTHRPTQMCNQHCQTAEGSVCVCSCQGLYHRVAAGFDWTAQEIEGVIPADDEEWVLRVFRQEDRRHTWYDDWLIEKKRQEELVDLLLNRR